MQIGGFNSAGAIWLNSLGKTGAQSGSEIFPTDRAGQKEPAKPAAANTHFPTTPPVSLGAEMLLALQQPEAPPAGAANAAVDDAPAEPLESSAEDQFLDYMKKTPEERLRDKILKALGLTEEDLEAMPAEERLAIEEKIAEIVKETIVPDEVTRGVKAEPGQASPFSTLLQAALLA